MLSSSFACTNKVLPWRIKTLFQTRDLELHSLQEWISGYTGARGCSSTDEAHSGENIAGARGLDEQENEAPSHLYKVQPPAKCSHTSSVRTSEGRSNPLHNRD